MRLPDTAIIVIVDRYGDNGGRVNGQGKLGKGKVSSRWALVCQWFLDITLGGVNWSSSRRHGQ